MNALRLWQDPFTMMNYNSVLVMLFTIKMVFGNNKKTATKKLKIFFFQKHVWEKLSISQINCGQSLLNANELKLLEFGKQVDIV